MEAEDRSPKVCASCGREFTWRKKWRNNWAEVKYCSAACRSRRIAEIDVELEDAILSLLAQRSPQATICPSEAARQVWNDRLARNGDSTTARADDGEGWRQLMEPTRRAARRLVETRQLEIVQKGRAVDPSTARGPIRLRRLSSS